MREKHLPATIVLFLIMAFPHFSLNAQSLQGSFDSKYKRYLKNEAFTRTAERTWSTVVWKGERVHTQVILWSDSDINGLSYSLSNFENATETISKTNASLRFSEYIKGDPQARSCSEYPTHPSVVEITDALSTKEINDVSASDPIKLWLTIEVPASTKAGIYRGFLTVKGGNEPVIFTIEIEVTNYILPDVSDWDFHLDLWQFPLNILNHHNTANPSTPILPWSNRHFELLEPFYKLLADAGQKAITTYVKEGALGASSMVRWTKKMDDTWEYDFTAFDKYVSTLMSWGITTQINCFSPVGWNEEVIPYWDEATATKLSLNAPLGSSAYNTRWDDFLTAFKTHLKNKGWFDKAVLYLDEVSETKLNHVVSVVHGNDPDWKLGIAYSHGLSNASKDNFYDLSGILEDASNDGIAENKISTFYTSCTQTRPNNYVSAENSPAEMTWMAWHAFKEGFDGYLRWAFDYWRRNDPLDARDGAHTAGDFSMVYRESNNFPSKVLPSIRFEMLREGIQDYEKLRILKAILGASTDRKDTELLNQLEAAIDKFKKTSGADAEQLVIQAQQVIADISSTEFNVANENFNIEAVGETCTGKGNGQLHISSKKPFDFEVALDGRTYPFNQELTIANLEPKNYTLCITSPTETDFEQCYEVNVPQAPQIAAKAMISKKEGKTIALISVQSGSPPFSIHINDELITETFDRSYELEVEHGDVLSISTTRPCQGTYTQSINSGVVLYPNPTDDRINLVVSDQDRGEIPISIFDLQNGRILEQVYPIENHTVSFSMATFAAGIYWVKLESSTPQILKVIKR